MMSNYEKIAYRFNKIKKRKQIQDLKDIPYF